MYIYKYFFSNIPAQTELSRLYCCRADSQTRLTIIAFQLKKYTISQFNNRRISTHIFSDRKRAELGERDRILVDVRDQADRIRDLKADRGLQRVTTSHYIKLSYP